MRLICEIKDVIVDDQGTSHAPMSYQWSDLKTVNGYIRRLKRSMINHPKKKFVDVLIYSVSDDRPFKPIRYLAYLGTMERYWDGRVNEFRSTSELVNHDLAQPINL